MLGWNMALLGTFGAKQGAELLGWRRVRRISMGTKAQAPFSTIPVARPL